MKKIKIVFIHWKLVCGGCESALYDLVSLLDKSKFDITIFVIHSGGEWEQRFKDLGIKVVDSYASLHRSTTIFGKSFNYLRRKRIDTSRKNGGKNLLQISLRESFDIVVSYHTSYTYCQLVGFPKFGKKIRWIHGDVKTNEHFKNQILNLKDNVYRYDSIVCVSKSAQNSFSELTHIYNQVTTIYNPINSKDINTKAETIDEVGQDYQEYICAVGRLSPEKGYIRLIKIFNRISQIIDDVQLVIIGDGPEREELKRAIEKNGLAKRVHLLGYLSNPYPYIKRSKFLVISSFTEGLPVTAMEALCLGVPIVSSYPSVEELFGEHECGIITGIDDDSLYKGIENMLIDKLFYEKVKQNAITRSSYFNSDSMIKKVENILYSVLES